MVVLRDFSTKTDRVSNKHGELAQKHDSSNKLIVDFSNNEWTS
jgi:hypothetical protein